MNIGGLDTRRFSAAGRRTDRAVTTCKVGELLSKFTLCTSVGFEWILHLQEFPFRWSLEHQALEDSGNYRRCID